MLPGALNSMFSRTKSAHNIATRQTDKLHVHFCNLQVTSKVKRHSGVSLWNNLPDDIRSQTTLSLFKSKLKPRLCRTCCV